MRRRSTPTTISTSTPSRLPVRAGDLFRADHADLVSFGPNPFQGNHRVGDPGKRCEQTIIGCPPPPFPPHFLGLLTRLDLRIFDATCVGSLSPPFVPPPGFALDRGQCCGYAMQLYVQDKTWSDGHAGGFHRILTAPWAVCICNDLPHQPPVG